MRRSTPILTLAAFVALTGCGAARSVTGAAPAVLTAGRATSAVITTTGTGTVSATPDVVTVQIGVQSTAGRAAGALHANNLASAAVQASLVRHGVPIADIQTEQLSLFAQQSGNRVTGYQVSDVVSATIHNLARAGTVIDAAVVAAGDGGRLDGVSFSIANDSRWLAEARRQAVAAARTDALQLAGGAGLKLLGLRSIVDQTDGDGTYPQGAEAGVSASTAAVPLQPGTQQTTVQISAVWNVGP